MKVYIWTYSDIRKGQIFLDGEDITNLRPQERVLKGMGFVPQTNNIFPNFVCAGKSWKWAHLFRHENCEDMLILYL